MAQLQDIVQFCDERTQRCEYTDFPGAENGLQVENNGTVQKIGAAVDAGKIPFEKAVSEGVDFLIVHHGLFWSPLCPITGKHYQKLQVLFKGNCALYSNHLPLDANPDIGNNALIAKNLGLSGGENFLEYEGMPVGHLAPNSDNRGILLQKLEKLFPTGVTPIEYGSETPKKIAIVSGSGGSAIPEIKKYGADTLITGELKQNHYNMAQEEGLNVYACGHYATEVFGVQALAKEVSEKFGLEWIFIQTDCPL